MASFNQYPNKPNRSDSIQILIDEFQETKNIHNNNNLNSSHQQQRHHPQKQQHKQLHSPVVVTPAHNNQDGNGGGFLGIQESFKRERRNSWCSGRPSEALANLKRKWFAGVSGSSNGKSEKTGTRIPRGGDEDDADDTPGIERGTSKSFSLTSLDGEEDSVSDDEKLSITQTPTTDFLDRPCHTTLSSSPVPGYRGDERFLGDDLFSGRNARSEQDIRGSDEKIEDKMIEVPDLTQLRGERFSLESDNLFAVKIKPPVSILPTDVQASSQLDGVKRCASPTPLIGCPDKNNRSDHPNLDLLVARHKSEGSLQRYHIREIKTSSLAQRKSSVLSKINSYRNSRKNNKVPPVENHHFVSISSSSSSSSSSHFNSINPSSVCEVCSKPLNSKKTLLKCLDCGLLTHPDGICKEQAMTYICSIDETRLNSNAKSEDISDSSAKLNKGNSSTTTTTTESDSLDLPDLSNEEGDVVFGTPGNNSAQNVATGNIGAPTVIGGQTGNDDEEAWSLTVDEHVINSLSPAEIKRQNLIWELIRNEKHHYRILKMMMKIFVGGLKSEVGLEPAMVNQLFPGLDGLINVHGNILKALLKQQSLRQDKRVDDLSSVLLEQFGGSNGCSMEILYGEFCSQHERAINLYKELKRNDRKFQNFINKCVGIVACERRGIDSCILTVTQRLTKYPLLVDQILKYTSDEIESKGLSDFLQLVRSIISAVNDQVDFVARRERFEEIFDKLDPKSTTTLGSKTIKRADILNMEKYLRFHGWIKLKTARGRTIDTLVVVLTDWVVMLTESNHKYFFSNIDNKSSMIPLSQLLVREKDDKHEGRNFFLISSNKNTPAEMYELICKSNSELKYWTSVLRQATTLSATKTDTHLDLLSLVKSDQTQLISLIETLQIRDEEVRSSVNQKILSIEEFYKTLEKLSPTNTINESIKQMMLAQHLSAEDLVVSVHVQETNLIACLQCGSHSDQSRRSLSKDRESSSLESLNSRRTSSASLISKVSHSGSFRNIADPSSSSSFSSIDPSLHHSSSDVVEAGCDGLVDETVRIKRKSSDASMIDSKYPSKTSHGMLPGLLSIFCKDKEETMDANDDLHKHRKQSSLTSSQQNFTQQQQQSPLQTVLHQQSSMLMQQISQQINKVSTPEQQQQQQISSNNSNSIETLRPILSSEAEERLCNFLNSVHNLSTMVLDLSTEVKKKEVQIICMTKQLDKLEKQSMEKQMEELRAVQNQVQLEKFQLQELRNKHLEEVDKLNEERKQQNLTFELQKTEIKSQKDELQRQRDALQRQIDLFEENKSSFNTRLNNHQQQQQQILSSCNEIEDSPNNINNSIVSGKRHERNHSTPLNLTGKQFSTSVNNSTQASRSGSPSVYATIHQLNNSINKQCNKQARVGLGPEAFEAHVDEKNGVLVTKKDSVPLLPVHLISAKNESKLDRHTSSATTEDFPQPIKQIFPTKLATTTTLSKQKEQQQASVNKSSNNNSNGGSNIDTNNRVDDRNHPEDESSKPTLSSSIYRSKHGNNNNTCNQLPLHLAEKSRTLTSSSSLSHNNLQLGNNNSNKTLVNSFPSILSRVENNHNDGNGRKSSINNNAAIPNSKPTRSIFATTKKFSQLLSPTSPSSTTLPSPTVLEAMMTSTILSPKVQFLSFPNYPNTIGGVITSPPSSSSSSSPLSSAVANIITKSDNSVVKSSTTPTIQPTNQPIKCDQSSKTKTQTHKDDDEVIFL